MANFEHSHGAIAFTSTTLRNTSIGMSTIETARVGERVSWMPALLWRTSMPPSSAAAAAISASTWAGSVTSQWW